MRRVANRCGRRIFVEGTGRRRKPGTRGHAAVRAVGRGRLVVADHRSADQFDLRRHRRQLLAAGGADVRRGHGVRPATRRDQMGEPDDRGRRVHYGVRRGRHTNCPEEAGPDHDFGQSPILVALPAGSACWSPARSPVWCTPSIPTTAAASCGERHRPRRRARRHRMGIGERRGRALRAALRLHVQGPGAIGRGGLDPRASAAACSRSAPPTDQVLWTARSQRLRRPALLQPGARRTSRRCPGMCFPDRSTATCAPTRTAWPRHLGLRHRAGVHDGRTASTARGGSIDVGGPGDRQRGRATTSGYGTWGGMRGNVLLAFSVDGNSGLDRLRSVSRASRDRTYQRPHELVPTTYRLTCPVHARFAPRSPPFNSTLRLAIVRPRPVPVALVEEVGLEDPRERLAIHSDSGVGDLDGQRARRRRACIRGRDGQRPGARHRVQRVLDDVRDGPGEQRAIDVAGGSRRAPGRRWRCGPLRPSRYGPTTSSTRSPTDVGSGCGVGDEAKLENSAAICRSSRTCDEDGGDALVEHRRQRPAAIDVHPLRVLGGQLNRRQRVLDVVRHLARHVGPRLEALRAFELAALSLAGLPPSG